jgi:hypothetical protein
MNVLLFVKFHFYDSIKITVCCYMAFSLVDRYRRLGGIASWKTAVFVMLCVSLFQLNVCVNRT